MAWKQRKSVGAQTFLSVPFLSVRISPDCSNPLPGPACPLESGTATPGNAAPQKNHSPRGHPFPYPRRMVCGKTGLGPSPAAHHFGGRPCPPCPQSPVSQRSDAFIRVLPVFPVNRS